MRIKFFLHAKQWLSIKSLKILMGNPGRAGLMILFDALFLASFFGLQILFRYFSTQFQFLVFPTSLTAFMLYIFLTLIYFLVILFTYSFFKYGVLDSIKSAFGRTEFSFNRFAQFYFLNIIISGKIGRAHV